MFSRANISPKLVANSRASGSTPKRAPQNTQIEEGGGTDTASGTAHAVCCLVWLRRLSGPGRHGIIWAWRGATPNAVGRRTIGSSMSRTVLALMAMGAVVIAVALGVAWRVKMDDQAALDAVKPAAKVAAAPEATPSPAAVPSETKPSPNAPAVPPSFDVARIGPDGRRVFGGRAAPGAKIVLPDGGKEIARGEADGRGEWVLLAQDPPLAPGPHELRAVEHVEGRAPVTSEQVVVAVVPSPPGSGDTATAKEETLVLISPSSGATTLVQPPSKAGVPRAADLQVSTMDYDERGQTTITGQATPGATVRAYLDDKVVAEGKAGPDGRFRLAPAEPLGLGQHKLRLDRLA